MTDLPEDMTPAVNHGQVRFAFIASIVSMFVGAFLGILITFGFAGPLEQGDDLPRWTIMISEAMIVVPLIVLLKNRNMDLLATFRLRNVSPIIWRDSIIIAIGVTVLVDELDRLIAMVFPFPEAMQAGLAFMTYSTPWEAMLIFGGAAVVAPIAEEIIFRGFFQGQLEEGYGDATRAIVYSALLFMMLHFNPWWALQIYILGMVLGFLAWRTASIWPAIVLHAANNFASVLLSNGEEGGPNWYSMGDHVSPVWLAVAAGMAYSGFKSLIEETTQIEV